MAAAGAIAEAARLAAQAPRPTGKQREPGPLPAHIAGPLQQLKARIVGRRGEDAQSLPARVWSQMDTAVRTAFVMLAIDTPGDPREIARQAWDSFSDTDKRALAATARIFQAETKSAGCLW
jgi:hypothetical protein